MEQGGDLLNAFDPEFRLLFNVLDVNEANSSIQIPEQFSFDRFIEIIMKHQVVAGLGDSIGKLKPLFSDEENRQLLAIINQRVFEQLSLTKELFDMLKAFKDADIEVITLKGPLLSHELFDSFGRRESMDLDFMVRQEDYFKAEEVVLGFDYASTNYDLSKFSKAQLSAYQNYFCDSSFIRRENGWRMIDIHWRMFDSAKIFPKTIDQIFDDADHEQLQGVAITRLSKADTLLYLAIHGSKHEWSKLKWLLDIKNFMLKHGDDIDWTGMVDGCVEHKIHRPLVMAVYLSHILFGTSLPEPIGRQYKADKKIEALVNGALATIAKIDFTGNRLKRSKAMLRLKPDSGLYYHYFKRLWLAPQDWMSIALPKRFFFLYFFLRPFMLFKRSIKKQAK